MSFYAVENGRNRLYSQHGKNVVNLLRDLKIAVIKNLVQN